MYKPQYPGLYYFDNFTFTTLGTSGARGPDASKTYANAPWRDGDFYIKDGQQYWTVPANGTYQIEAAGAYGAAPGRVVSGQVKLNEGQTLKMLVGQCPNPLVSNVQDNVTVGGGGGTFVVSGDTPLIVASGGDGGQFANTYNLFQSFPGPIICSALSGDGNTLFTVVDAGEANDPRGIAYFYTREVNSWVQQNYQVPWPDDPFGIESASFNFDGTVLLIGMAVNDYAGVSKLTTNGIWSPFTQLSAGAASGQRFGSSVALSSDGTVAIVSASYIYYVSCFRFNGSMWSSPTVITTLYGPAIDINSDGTVVIAGKNLGGVAVFRYSGGLWDSGTVITHTSVPFTYFGASVSISNDGNTILVGAPVGSLLITGEYAALYTYNGSTWINSANLYPPIPYSGFGSPVRLSGDGTTAFVSALAGLNGGYVVGFRNGIGSMFQVSRAVNFGRQLCTMYTGNEAFAAGDFYSDFNGIFTYTVSQHASFTPSGNGSGKQGAGYLTDGYSTDPYFKFLKPKAYVNGGFGNAYQYGSIPEQGGFGGGQSPILLQNQISLISGNAFVRPILTASTAYLSFVKLSYNGNVCMTYESTRVVKIFRFAGGVWSSPTTISSGRTTPSISLSWDGNVALFGGGAYVGVIIYSNGSWGTVTQLTNSSSSVALSGDGQTALIGSLTVTSVFKYLNGSWGTATVIQSPASKVALNFNGTKAVLNANVYQFSGSVWSKQKQLTDSITNFASCSISGDGTQVLISETRGRTFLFNLTTGTSSQLVNNYNGSSLSSDGSFITINEKYNVYGNTYTLSPVPVSIAQQNGLRSDIGGSNVFCIWAIGSSNIWFGSVTQPYTTINVTTTNKHGFPYEYIVQIQGTQGYDGTWPITVTSENTFTFEGFGGIYGTPETAGYISGPVTGISGGGGYTGSPGDGVSGATCYADESVENFTDLGPKSNTAGYVTVSLIDPKPLTETWSLSTQWNVTNQIMSNGSFVWFEKLGQFVAISENATVLVSNDGITWTSVPNNLPIPYIGPFMKTYILIASPTKLIAVEYYTGIWSSSDAQNWTLTFDSPYDWTTSFYFPYLCGNYTNGRFIVNKFGTYFVSTDDGQTWSVPGNGPYPIKIVYGNGTYLGILPVVYHNYYCGRLYTSTDLVTWSSVTDSNVAMNIYPGWTDIIFENGTFIASSTTPIYSSSYIYKTITSSDAIQWYGNISGGGGFVYGNNVFISLYDNSFSLDNGNTWLPCIGKQPTQQGFYSPKNNYYLFTDGFQFYTSLEGKYIVPAKEGIITNGFPCNITWADTLGILVAVTTFTIIISNDGINWKEVLNFGGTLYGRDATIAWSRELGILIAYFCNSNTGYVPWLYTSFDGLTWKKTILQFQLTEMSSFYYHANPCWSSELGIFTSGSAISRDGIHWIQSNDGGLPGIGSIAWSPKLGLFSGCLSEYRGGQTFYSLDGLLWTPLEEGMGPFTRMSSITWSNKLGMFIGVFTPFASSDPLKIYNSFDGLTWTQVYTDTNAGADSRVIWSEELGIAVVFTSGIRTLISYDGVNWSSSSSYPYSISNISITWSPGLQMFAGVNAFSSVVLTLSSSKSF